MSGPSPGRERFRVRARASAGGALAPAFALLLAAAPAAAAEPEGVWATPDDRAHVRIQPCADGLCGDIVWLREPLDERGLPKRDRNNEDEAERERPILGLPMLRGFRAVDPGRWEDGRIYNPEDGRTYRAKLHLAEPGRLSVSGCVLIFCKAQDWRRVE